MADFIDVNGHYVRFIYEPESFPEQVKHVLVICKYENKWLLTNHKKRGWEFPGGKVENNESLEQAANREVYEETGAILNQLYPVGSYKVCGPMGSFVKKVFFGIVDKLEKNDDYLETNGPVLVDEDLLLTERFQPHYSFIMQDRIVEFCFEKVKEKSRGCNPV